MNVDIIRSNLIRGDFTCVLFDSIDLWFYIGSSDMPALMRSVRDICREVNYLKIFVER